MSTDTFAAFPRPEIPPRSLGDLCDFLAVTAPADEAGIRGITLDSRRVAEGDLYAALPGANFHGAQFATSALEAGAVAVLTDQTGHDLARADGVEAPIVVVPDVRAILGGASSWIYGHPSRELKMIGITGTDGKTTTAMLTEAGLRACGHVPGLIGTVVTRVGESQIRSVRTTPEAPDLHALLAYMCQQGATAAVMEVSSHAIALHRVDGVEFDVAVFTNLGHDHLDFHGTVENYFQTKAKLFEPGYSKVGVICVDDRWGARLAADREIPVQTYSVAPGPGVENPQAADWWVEGLVWDNSGWHYRLNTPTSSLDTGCQLPGVFNVRNAIAAVAAIAAVGGAPVDVAAGVATCDGVPGRMQRVGAQSGYTAFVDYAHTPDAVGRAIEVGRAIASVTGGKVKVLLGCGGDRDIEKRPIMGAVAASGADEVFITDDNPRSEDPAKIRREMLSGVMALPHQSRAIVHEIGDRAAAIAALASASRPNDVLLVLGKGHETTQEVRGEFLPFDDAAELAAALG